MNPSLEHKIETFFKRSATIVRKQKLMDSVYCIDAMGIENHRLFQSYVFETKSRGKINIPLQIIEEALKPDSLIIYMEYHVDTQELSFIDLSEYIKLFYYKVATTTFSVDKKSLYSVESKIAPMLLSYLIEHRYSDRELLDLYSSFISTIQDDLIVGGDIPKDLKYHVYFLSLEVIQSFSSVHSFFTGRALKAKTLTDEVLYGTIRTALLQLKSFCRKRNFYFLHYHETFYEDLQGVSTEKLGIQKSMSPKH